MMKNNLNIDISPELVLYRYHNGIKLARPEQILENAMPTRSTLARLTNMPFNIYFVDTRSVIQFANEPTVKVCGFDSEQHAIGKTVEKVAKKETVLFEHAHEQKVMKENKLIILQENFKRFDGVDLPYVAFKFPWYNAENKIVGVFGCSLPLDGPQGNFLSQTLSMLVATDLLSMQNTPDVAIAGVSLTMREKDCIRLLCKGFTAKQTAKELCLSPRTVENYIANIKCKLDVSTKAELLEKIRLIHAEKTN